MTEKLRCLAASTAAAAALASTSALATGAQIPPINGLPEPSTWLLLAGGAAAAVVVSRIRGARAKRDAKKDEARDAD